MKEKEHHVARWGVVGCEVIIRAVIVELNEAKERK